MGDPRQIGPNAPTGTLQYDADVWVGRGCDECLAWSAQVHVDDRGLIYVLEHHAVGCPTYQEELPQHASRDE